MPKHFPVLLNQAYWGAEMVRYVGPGRNKKQVVRTQGDLLRTMILWKGASPCFRLLLWLLPLVEAEPLLLAQFNIKCKMQKTY